MRIDCYFTHQSCEESDCYGKTAVVIDVLRATSSIITALMAGAAAVIPIAEVAEALRLAAQMPETILAGEREGEKLEAFDLGNSPREFHREAVAGRVIIACTTNGTAAILKTVQAEKTWLAALLNAQAVADKLLQHGTDELVILCAGTDGQPSLDDILTAGALLHHLSRSLTPPSLEMNDCARMALQLYESYAPLGMRQALALTGHAQTLTRFGRQADVDYCAQENITATVPWLNGADGRIYG